MTPEDPHWLREQTPRPPFTRESLLEFNTHIERCWQGNSNPPSDAELVAVFALIGMFLRSTS